MKSTKSADHFGEDRIGICDADCSLRGTPSAAFARQLPRETKSSDCFAFSLGREQRFSLATPSQESMMLEELTC